MARSYNKFDEEYKKTIVELYENEIRASTIIVIDIINKKLSGKFNSIMINDYIWLRGQDNLNKVLPYHLTRTNFY